MNSRVKKVSPLKFCKHLSHKSVRLSKPELNKEKQTKLTKAKKDEKQMP
jgi:hypothetical protein